MQLTPQEKFLIVHQLADPNDGGTYYVQAVIRRTLDDSTIATVNLTHQSEQRYTGEWEVPQDPTGRGFYVNITTKVYTDSGYTTLSTTYGAETQTHLIQTRINANHSFGGGGADISYDKVRKIVQEEVGKIEMPVFPKIPEQKEVDLSSVLERLYEINIAISKLPKTIEDNNKYESIKSLIDGVVSSIKNIPSTDTKPLQNSITSLEKSLSTHKEMSDKNVLNIVKSLAEQIKMVGQEILKEVNDNFTTKEVTLSFSPKENKKKSSFRERIGL